MPEHKFYYFVRNQKVNLKSEGIFSFLFHFEVEKGLRVLRRLKKYIESSAELWKIELAGFSKLKISEGSGEDFRFKWQDFLVEKFRVEKLQL